MAKKRILIIDDEVSFTHLVRRNLEETGEYDVREENSGTHGLAAAREFRPDLILLDIIMPDMGGAEVAERVKADETLKEVPIVFLTAAVSREEAETHGGLIGGHPFLAKPVTEEELLACLKENLR